jgi:hypothetical protein
MKTGEHGRAKMHLVRGRTLRAGAAVETTKMTPSMLCFRRRETRKVVKLARALAALDAPPRRAPKRVARVTLGV